MGCKEVAHTTTSPVQSGRGGNKKRSVMYHRHPIRDPAYYSGALYVPSDTWFAGDSFCSDCGKPPQFGHRKCEEESRFLTVDELRLDESVIWEADRDFPSDDPADEILRRDWFSIEEQDIRYSADEIWSAIWEPSLPQWGEDSIYSLTTLGPGSSDFD